MYITSKDALQRALSERISRREEARNRVNEFVRTGYGIPAMTEILPRFFSFLHQEEPVAFLARQVASMCVEDVAFEVGARSLGLQPVVVPFGQDTFTKDNHDKLHRVKIPWTSWSKKGHLVLAHERICQGSNDDIEGLPLDRIICGNGESLPRFHQGLRARANITAATTDVSPLHTFLLTNAPSRPQFIFRETAGGRVEKRSLAESDLILTRDRPPASWYYPYYLSWFIDGTMVLFETYDNPIGEVCYAKAMFEKAMHIVTAETGFVPLVVKIPPLSKDMLYCNRHFLEKSDSVQSIAHKAAGVEVKDTVAFFRSIADAAIAFR